MLTYEDLFMEYQDKLDWANRMIKSFPSQEQEWKRVKFAVFLMFEELRACCDDAPECREHGERGACVHYGSEYADKYPAKKSISEETGVEYEFPVIGELTYRGLTLPIYDDDYGLQSFVTFDGEDIPILTIGGSFDWYYQIDKHLDKID